MVKKAIKKYRKKVDNFPNKNFGDLSIGEETKDKDDLLVSYDFNFPYLSAQIDKNNTWPKVGSTCPFEKCLSNSVCTFFNSGRWNELNRPAFSVVKNHNPENSIFQHLPRKERIINPHKNNRLETINRRRKGLLIDSLTSVEIVELVKCEGVLLEV